MEADLCFVLPFLESYVLSLHYEHLPAGMKKEKEKEKKKEKISPFSDSQAPRCGPSDLTGKVCPELQGVSHREGHGQASFSLAQN